MRKITGLIILFFSCTNTWAQISQGPQAPANISNSALTGSLVSWTSIGEAGSSNDFYDTATALMSSGNYTDYLVVSGFSFNIPTGATIDGIEVSVEKKGVNRNCEDYQVRIVKGGLIGSSDHSIPGLWPDSDTVITYGDTNDLWGEVWTPLDINGSGFGFAIAVVNSGTGAAIPYIDQIQITVHYTAILQVGFTQFNLNATSDHVYLEWNVEKTPQGGYFQVERASSTLAFSPILILDLNSNASYTARDYQPLLGENFYRIRQVDRFGMASYSEIRKINWDEKLKVTCFPQPVTSGERLHLKIAHASPIILEVYSLQGDKVYEERLSVSEELILDTDSFSPGTYVYKLAGNFGKVLHTGKILIK